MTKAVVVAKGLSPDEEALLQIARDLGIVGSLLEEARRRDEEKKKKTAYEEALRIATNAWQQAVSSGAKIARVEVTVESGGVEATAIYPAPVPRSKTKTTGNKRQTEAYPDALVAALKEEAKKRGAIWYGVQNAIRTKWGKEIYERFMTIPTDSATADSTSDSATA